MNDLYFIHDQALVDLTLKTLRSTGQTTGYLCETFIDPDSGLKWEKYPMDYNEDGDDEFGLRRIPYPTTEKLVDLAIKSNVVDEVEGAAMLLKDQEWNHRVEFREALIESIELNWNTMDANRFSIISGCTELIVPMNRREIVGKSNKEIESDFKYFENLSIRAKELERRLGLNADRK